jgi:tetratricopeptide (TPR) repeat protein
MSAGRDDYALHYFMQSKFYSDKLNYTNPDRSLGYCGLGSVLFNTEEYKISLRSFLKAREIREKLLGSEHVDTATCYNNLGCCMFMLERNNEAIAYFKIAHAIFECELGNFHNRTLTAARNIKKAEKGAFKNIPEFKTLWENYEEDPFKKKKKKKDKKKKK